MNLSAPILTSIQRCKRLYALERDYRIMKWRPRALLDHILREAVFKLSNGQDVIITSKEACADLLTEAANPGMETAHDPFTLARDYCAIIENVLEALSRLSLLVLSKPGYVPLGDTEHAWKLSAFTDESGLLHRWVFVEKWDEDTQYKEYHSWNCFGDCAAAQVGMCLHVVEIGRQSKSHQNSYWTRAYKHPAIHNHYRFRKVDGTPLDSSWIPVWYQDSDSNTPKGWVDLMEEDRLDLIHHIHIKEPTAENIKQFHADIEYEVNALTGKMWRDYPISRPTCDLPLCRWQGICYSQTKLVNVDSIGGYQKV